MATVTVIPTNQSFPLIRLPKIHCHPFLCALLFVACDAFAIMLTGVTVLPVWHAKDGSMDFHGYLSLWPALLVFFSTFALLDLYPGIIHNAVTELRRLAFAVTLSFLVLASFISISGLNLTYPHRVLFLSWTSAIFVTPLLRSIVRAFVCRKRWWGIPVAVFYTGEEANDIVRELEAHPEIGLRPVVLLSSSYNLRRPGTLPVVDIRLAASVRACGVERAMIALPETGSSKLLADLEKFENLFPRLMIVQSSAALYSLGVNARQLAGCLALEVRRDLLLPLPRITKRSLDLLLVCLLLPSVALTILLLGLLVKLESSGPIFYRHRRVGRGQTTFQIWKIRTMKANAEELLRNALASDPALREEWQRDRKLRNDPRITRIGRFLRKTSLDELPQLWNVLRGDMSLVGPRPIVEEEIAGYGQNFSLYCKVTPGLTGLWQVSGRNAVSRRDRVRLDSYYVRNWSPWLDLHILARTARVVLTGEGAY
jgi:Undecaprenyl-phosphate galactose phosphotransferase WbaP